MVVAAQKGGGKSSPGAGQQIVRCWTSSGEVGSPWVWANRPQKERWHGADPRPAFLMTLASLWVLVAATPLEVPQVQNSGFGSQFYYLCSLASSSSVICAPRL
uniref:Uncharacterized protein n=1 Tax=Micrurus lemniscatus lemniscatus TaxID=129467 RepID=A0A2D4JGI3_MICLE